MTRKTWGVIAVLFAAVAAAPPASQPAPSASDEKPLRAIDLLQAAPEELLPATAKEAPQTGNISRWVIRKFRGQHVKLDGVATRISARIDEDGKHFVDLTIEEPATAKWQGLKVSPVSTTRLQVDEAEALRYASLRGDRKASIIVAMDDFVVIKSSIPTKKGKPNEVVWRTSVRGAIVHLEVR